VADPGALAFPPLPRADALAEWSARAASALELDCLPACVPGAEETVAAAYPARLAALLRGGAEEEEGGRGEGVAGVLPPAPSPPTFLTSAPPPLARAGSPAFDARRRFLALLGWEVRPVNPATVKLRAAAAAAAADAAGAAAARAVLAAGPDAPLPPLKLPPPPDPRAPILPPGSVRACDAALECATCGAMVGLWAHAPPSACPSSSSGGGMAATAPSPLALATLGRRGSSFDGGAGALPQRPRSSSLDGGGTPLGGRTIAGGTFLPSPSPDAGGGGGSPAPAAGPRPPVFGLAALRSMPVPAGHVPAAPPAPRESPGETPPAKRTRASLRSRGGAGAGPPGPPPGQPPPPPPPAVPAPSPSPALLAATAGALAASAGGVPWPPPGAGVPAAPVPLDPVSAHRRWCPWVHGGGGGGGGGAPAPSTPRTGWQWVLPLLIRTPGPEEALGRKVAEAAAAAEGEGLGLEEEEEEEEEGKDGSGRLADPAARLRAAMLQAGL